jgi:hypothetical protein
MIGYYNIKNVRTEKLYRMAKPQHQKALP